MSSTITATMSRPTRRNRLLDAGTGVVIMSLDTLAPHTLSTATGRALNCRSGLRPLSVVRGQEPGNQPIDAVRPDPGAADEPEEQEDRRCTDLQIEPVPGQRTTQGGHKQEDAYLRKEGEIGSGLARQSARSVASAKHGRQTPGPVASRSRAGSPARSLAPKFALGEQDEGIEVGTDARRSRL